VNSDLRIDPERRADGTHPVNIGHLVMGLAFAGLVVVWAVVQADVVDRDDVRWLLPIPWVVAGAAGLVVAALAGRRRDTPPPGSGWVGDQPPTDQDPTDPMEENQ
jgi:hypothetical protein